MFPLYPTSRGRQVHKKLRNIMLKNKVLITRVQRSIISNVKKHSHDRNLSLIGAPIVKGFPVLHLLVFIYFKILLVSIFNT